MTQSKRFFWGRPSACLRLALVCLLPVFLATCGEDGPGGPSGPPVIGQVEFTSGPITSNGYFGPNLPINRVHVRIVRPPSDVLRDTTRAFDPNQNRLRFDLPVLLTAAAESLDVTLELLNGTTVLFSGTSRLEARAGPPSGATPPAIPLAYFGPGSNIAQVALSPLDSVLSQGDSLIMQVTGLDANQLPVPAFYVGWSSSDTTVARVNGAGVVRGRVGRGTVFIRARTPDTQLFPTGIIESTTVTLVPDPATLIKVGGDNQTAALGTTLPQMLAVEVRAGDNLPIAGVQVAFATADPGASVDSAIATTDANGIARTHAVLGTGTGTQSYTASVPGTTTVTFTATSTAAPTPTWTGAVSTDWHNASNWNVGFVPGASDSVTIPAGPANQPTLVASGATVGPLVVDGTLTLTNFGLIASGNVRGAGSITSGGVAGLDMVTAGTTLDLATLPSMGISAGVTLGRTVNITGNLTIGGAGDLIFANHTANVTGDVITIGAGTITMTGAVDSLKVLGRVTFAGGSTFGKITSGVIFLRGNFSQQAGNSPQSYAPTGNHILVFNGTGVQLINFATPGATGSNFETLAIANSAGGVTLASDVFLAGPVGFAPGVPRIAHGSGQTLFVAELQAANATLDNILVAANNVLLTQFDSINFINYSPAATPLTISHPGSATPLVMNDLSFGVTPTSGFYVSATDLVADANVLTLNMVNTTPAASGGLVRTQGGAVVNWPFVPAGARTWTGAVSNNWFTAGNWSPAVLPVPGDDVIIPATAQQPVLSGTVSLHNLTVQSGAIVTSNSDMILTGNASVPGSFLGGPLVMTTHGTSVAGNISNLEIDLPTRFESVLVSGALTVSGLIEVQRGHLDVGGNTVTAGAFKTVTEGMLKMVNPAGALIVNGNADFGGEDPTGVLTAGTIRIRGNFAQLTGVTQGSFIAGGTNRVILDGTGPQFVTFSNPGINVSRFRDLEIANIADTVFMGSDWAATGQLIKQAAGSVVVSGAAQLITTNGVAVSGVEFNNARLALLVGTVSQFDNVSWTGLANFVTQLTVTRPTGTLTFGNHTFASTPITGFYLRADDTNPSDGQVLTINMVTPNPVSPGGFVQLAGGAVVNWPSGPSPVNTWTGAVSINWNTAGNWSTNAVPVPADSVVIPNGMPNNPTLTGRAKVKSLLQNAQLTVSGTLEVTEDLVGTVFSRNTIMGAVTDSVIIGDSLSGNLFGLSGGTLVVGGSIGTGIGGSPITIVLNGTGAQVWNQGPSSGLGPILVTKTAGSVSFPIGVRTDSLHVFNAIPLSGSGIETAGNLFAGGNLTLTGSLTIGANLTVLGTFSHGNATTRFRPSSPMTITIPALAYGGLSFETQGGSSTANLVGRTTVNGLLLVQGIAPGFFSLNGNTLEVTGSVLNNGSGATRIVMTNPLDSLIVSGSVDFQAGVAPIPPGNLTAGTLLIGGNFSQTQPFGGAQFQATGTHTTVFTGANPVISFATPGTANSQSRFANLRWMGGGALTLGGNVVATGTMDGNPGVNGTIASFNSSLQVGDFVSGVVTLNATTLVIDHPAATPIGLANITFTNMPSALTQLTVNHPGTASPLTFTGLKFQSVPSSGFYLRANDTDGASPNGLTINMSSPTPGTPGSFVQAVNGAVVNWPAGPAPATTWTGAVSTDWSVTGNWSTNAVPTFSDSVVIPAGGNQPTLTAQSFAGALHLANGTLTMGGQVLAVVSTFATSGSGRLVMTDPNDGLSVGGDAIFNGASELGFLTEGAIVIQGDLSQLATNSPDSYHPSVNHTTSLIGDNPTVTFATPGLVPGSSHFQRLIWSGTGTLTLGSNIFALAELLVTSSSATIITGAGQTITAGGFFGGTSVTTLDNVRLAIDQVSNNPLTLANLIFVNQDPTAVQLSIRHPGTFPGGVTTQSASFLSPPSTGFYLRAEDTAPGDGIPLTVDMNNVSPATPGTFVQTVGGAVVNWPGSGGGGASVWTGAVDDNWNNVGNWSGGIPQVNSDVVIPAGAPNYPVFQTNETINSLDIAAGASVDLVAGNLVIFGDLTGGGIIINGGPVMAGSGTILALSNLEGLTVTGDITQAGDLDVSGDVSIDGASARLTLGGFDFDISGNLSVTNDGTMEMNNPLTHVIVSGDLLFDGGSENGLLTDGLLEVQGDFTQANSTSTSSFRATGSHQVLMISGAPQSINFADSLQSFFRDLTLNNTTGITVFGIPTVTGTLLVSPGVSLDANSPSFVGDGFNVLGNVTTGAGSVLHLGRLYVGGTLTVGGTYNTTAVIFTGAGQTAPAGLPYQFLYSRGTVTFGAGNPAIQTLTVEGGALTLSNRTAVSSDVFITGGTLKPNGHTVVIGGALNVQTTGTLTMQNALDSVLVTGFTGFGGGSTVGLLTDGVLRVGGSFTQTAGTSSTSFAASGNHKTMIGAGAVRIVNFATPGSGGVGSHFGNVDVTAGTGDINLSSNLVADGAFISVPTGTAPTIVGGGKLITAMSLNVTRASGASIILENAPLIVNEQGTARTQVFDRAFFSQYPLNGTLMDLTLVGSNVAPRSLTFTAPNLQTSVTNLYTKLVSSNGQSVTLTISGSNDPTGGPSKSDPSFGTTVNGARIVWQ